MYGYTVFCPHRWDNMNILAANTTHALLATCPATTLLLTRSEKLKKTPRQSKSPVRPAHCQWDFYKLKRNGQHKLYHWADIQSNVGVMRTGDNCNIHQGLSYGQCWVNISSPETASTSHLSLIDTHAVHMELLTVHRASEAELPCHWLQQSCCRLGTFKRNTKSELPSLLFNSAAYKVARDGKILLLKSPLPNLTMEFPLKSLQSWVDGGGGRGQGGGRAQGRREGKAVNIFLL